AAARTTRPSRKWVEGRAVRLDDRLLARGRLVDLDDEFGSAHAHDGRGRADLHRFGRLLHHLARDRGEPSPGERRLELARVRGRIETVLVDREHTVGPERA